MGAGMPCFWRTGGHSYMRGCPICELGIFVNWEDAGNGAET
ncbi:hypothetical protein [Azospirillum argentinense]